LWWNWWTDVTLSVESGVVDVDWLTLASWGPYFIPFPLGWVRANWSRSWSCGRRLASVCVEVQANEWRTAVYKNCLRSTRGVCWPRSMLVCMVVGGSHISNKFSKRVNIRFCSKWTIIVYVGACVMFIMYVPIVQSRQYVECQIGGWMILDLGQHCHRFN
jgi:hypothetical protein